MPELEWSQPAREDLLAIVDYISDDNPDAVQWLKDDIGAKTARPPEHPRLYLVGRIEGTREMVVRENQKLSPLGEQFLTDIEIREYVKSQCA
ncbi:type II toxin-antitoxin system RelE/ParE family toxin [Sodalis sp. RH21]|uniref:type II toxin-antitoxin system RelE/ParE family toxin n=1 Tax=unclassified Sodalis (in: enterobacteria) TaxID=2636512 RepID=UPI0039B3A3A3